MSGIMGENRWRAQRTLLQNQALPSWRDNGNIWSLPAVKVPKTAAGDDDNFYDKARFDAHPRAFSPSGRRVAATGWKKHYPRREVRAEGHERSGTEYEQRLMAIQSQGRQLKAKQAAIRKADCTLWNLDMPSKKRGELIGPYRVGAHTRRMPEYSTQPETQRLIAQQLAKKTFGGRAPRAHHASDEFAFAEKAYVDKEFKAPPVSKYSVSQRLEADSHVPGYTGHVMGYRHCVGATVGRATRRCVYAYEPSPYDHARTDAPEFLENKNQVSNSLDRWN
jgi:hypothetical protein